MGVDTELGVGAVDGGEGDGEARLHDKQRGVHQGTIIDVQATSKVPYLGSGDSVVHGPAIRLRPQVLRDNDRRRQHCDARSAQQHAPVAKNDSTLDSGSLRWGPLL